MNRRLNQQYHLFHIRNNRWLNQQHQLFNIRDDIGLVELKLHE